jgi:hypothetical protein
MVRYWAILVGLAVGGCLLLRVAGPLVPPEYYGPGYWLGAAFLLSALLAGVSFLLATVEGADEVTHYEGTRVGDSVSLNSVTRGEGSFRWRLVVIFILMVCTELWLRGELGRELQTLQQVLGAKS